jgi:tetratricopeptide (TPR) repeat protein
MLAVPVLVLGGFELALRIVGYGYPTSYFVPGAVEGRQVLMENGRFGMRFFPRELVRRPPPTVMSEAKARGTVRIFLFGESAALGDPHPAYGMGRYLQVLLNERFPAATFEVVCTAMTAINSHAILPIAKECARYDGDVWLVYMGNNEMVGPFGASSVFGPKAPARWVVRANLGLRSTRLGQALTALGQAWAPSGRRSWGGMKMFLDQQVDPEDPVRGAVHENFRVNLEALVEAGLKSGANVILSTVASNLKDCAPFASVRREHVIGRLAEDWQSSYGEGQKWQEKGTWGEALRAYGKAASIDDGHAELVYRQAACHWALGEYEAARSGFEAARDLDALPFRADSVINATIRKVAAAHADDNVRLVDATAVLSERGGIPGEDQFYEHVHLTLEGNYILARAFGAEVEKVLPERVKRDAASEWATLEVCGRRLGLTDWNREAVCAELRVRLSQAPFSQQWGNEARLARIASEQERLRGQLNTGAAVEAIEIYRDAIRRAPEDHRLYANYAEFLTSVGQLDEAVAQWRRVETLLPHHHVAPFFLGKLRSRQGAYDEAKEALERCLARQPGAVDAMIELGHLETRRKRPAQAIVHYQEALARQPLNGSLYLDLAEAQAASGDRTQAVESLRQAVALDQSLWRAHYYLGVELAENEQVRAAEIAFAEAARLNPGFALAHLNWGVALVRQGRTNEATERFEATLKLDPTNAKAREYLDVLRSREQAGEAKEAGEAEEE